MTMTPIDWAIVLLFASLFGVTLQCVRIEDTLDKTVWYEWLLVAIFTAGMYGSLILIVTFNEMNPPGHQALIYKAALTLGGLSLLLPLSEPIPKARRWFF